MSASDIVCSAYGLAHELDIFAMYYDAVFCWLSLPLYTAVSWRYRCFLWEVDAILKARTMRGRNYHCPRPAFFTRSPPESTSCVCTHLPQKTEEAINDIVVEKKASLCPQFFSVCDQSWSISRKNQHGHGMRWMSMGRKNGLMWKTHKNTIPRQIGGEEDKK